MSVDIKNLEICIAEAERFLKNAKAAKEAQNKSSEPWMNPIENGAVRRSSMDLTRALAALRDYRR